MGRRKLTPEQETALVERYKAWRPGIDPETMEDLAREYGVSKPTYNDIITRSGVGRHRRGSQAPDKVVDPVAFGNELIRMLRRNAQLERALVDAGVPIPPPE